MKTKLYTIYRITNTVTNQSYIGKSAFMRHRMATHLCDLRAGRHRSRLLQDDFFRYGEPAFVFKAIEINIPEQMAAERENYHMEKHNSLGHYNTRP